MADTQTATEAIDAAIARLAADIRPGNVETPALTQRVSDLVTARAALVAQPTPERKIGFTQ